MSRNVLILENSLDAIDVFNPLTGMKTYSVDGLDPADADVSTSSYATINGSYLTNSRIPKRNIVIDAYLLGTRVGTENLKHRLYSFLRPSEFVTIRYKTKKIDVYATGYIEKVTVNSFDNPVKCQISIICVDPYFYSSEVETQTISQAVNGFHFVCSFPKAGIPFGEYNSSKEIIIENEGIETGIVAKIEFLTDGEDFEMIDSAKDKYLKLKYDFLQGDLLEINTNPMHKSIYLTRDSQTINLMPKFTVGSSWLTASTGINRYSASSSDACKMQVTIQFNDKYLGV